MTLGLAGVRTAPLHELEEAWKTEARRPRLFGELVAEPCLCGGVIEARATDPAIAEAVRVHNASTAHEQWATTTGWR
jgi:hypothetical protein